MGAVYEWPIGELKKEYNLEIAIETGTHLGDGATYLAAQNFKKVYTIELLEHMFDSNDFSNIPSIHAFLGSSVDVLPNILKENYDTPTLFWLDAHLPSHYGHPRDDETELPLKRELELIVENKNISRDVFIIDDVRIYEDGPYTSGDCPPDYKASDNERGIGFMCNPFRKTHLITKDNRSEGFLILEPLIPQGVAWGRSVNLPGWQKRIE